MKIYGALDSTESEKKIIEVLNQHDSHISLLSRQHAEDLTKIKKLEQRITLLEKWKNNQLLKERNQF